jgi:hypothetical protein
MNLEEFEWKWCVQVLVCIFKRITSQKKFEYLVTLMMTKDFNHLKYQFSEENNVML